MNTSKIIYTIAGVLVLALIVAFIVKSRQDQSASDRALQSQAPQQQSNLSLAPGQQNQQSQNPQSAQNNSNSQQSTQQQPTVTGCPKGTNVTQTDSNGRFKPTLDVANKTVTLETTMGNITIQLYDKDAPKTVENFICLAQQGYFNNVTFHRVSHGFVIQSGDPTGTGSGGTSVYGGKFEDELYADAPSYKAGYVKGVVAMANIGQPNTNTSQFFIMVGDHPELPKQYTIFGKVSAGQDVVDKIGALPVTPVLGPNDGKPTTTVTIKKAVIK